MTRMRAPDVSTALANDQMTAIVVLGAQEQHGTHLPLATDSIWGELLAGILAARLGGALVAPVLPISVLLEHTRLAGTITLRPETLAAVVDDYVSSLERHGFRCIVLLPSHGGNFAPVAAELPGLRERHPSVQILAYTDLLGLVEAAAAAAADNGVTLDEAGAHAGKWETSMMLAVEPDCVRPELGEAGYLGPLGPVLDQINRDGMQTITPNGVLGDPRKASAEHGRLYLERMADLIADQLCQR